MNRSRTCMLKRLTFILKKINFECKTFVPLTPFYPVLNILSKTSLLRPPAGLDDHFNMSNLTTANQQQVKKHKRHYLGD